MVKRTHPTQLGLFFDQADATQTTQTAPSPTRPTNRSECPPEDADGARRCPWVTCRYHLALHISSGRRSPRLYLNPVLIDADGELRLDTGLPMCALDVAALGGAQLSLIGALLGVSRERVRQVIDMTIETLRLDPYMIEEMASRPPPEPGVADVITADEAGDDVNTRQIINTARALRAATHDARKAKKKTA